MLIQESVKKLGTLASVLKMDVIPLKLIIQLIPAAELNAHSLLFEDQYHYLVPCLY